MKINDKLTKDIRDRISNITGKILWTNPNPTSGFESQTITLNSDDYDMLEVIYYIWKDDKSIHSTKALKGKKINLSGVIDFSSTTMYYAVRNLSYVNDTTLKAENCRAIRSTTSTVEPTNTACMIPIYIIGYKTGIF